VSDSSINKAVIQEAVKKLEVLRSLVKVNDTLGKETRSSFENTKEKKVLNKMSALPVENLKGLINEDIDLSELRKSGVTTLASVFLIESDKLHLMTSFPKDVIDKIKIETLKIYDGISELIPLGIDYENITKEELTLLDKVKELQSLGNNYEEYLPQIKTIIIKLEENLRHVEVFNLRIKWLFSNKETKTKAYVALDTLKVLLNENTTNEVVNIAKDAVENHVLSTQKDTLGDFKSNASDYFSIIEKNFGKEYNSKSTYMNDELVNSINSREFDPSKINANLRKYQIFGIKFALTQDRVILGDEMGLGKTLQAIGVLTQRIVEGGTHFIVVCPKAVLINWQREVESRTNIDLITIHGASQNHSYKKWVKDGGVAITTFDTLKNLDIYELENQGIDLNTIIADEAHFVKNPIAGRTKAMYQWVNYAQNALFMTGTPQENRPEEFIEIASLVNPSAMGMLHQSYLYQGAELFRREVAPIYLRRNLEEVLGELPDLIETTEYCSFEGADIDRYNIYQMLGNWMGMRRAPFIPAGEYLIPDKLERIKAIVTDSYSKGKKVIIFSYFKDVLNSIYKELEDTAYYPITGATSSTDRQRTIDEFTQNEEPCTVIGQIQALGTGLNIQAASVVIICEPQIKPSLEVQAIARSHRMGQVNKVYVYRLVVTSEELERMSIDEYITRLLDIKTNSFNLHARISELGDASAHLIDSLNIGDELEATWSLSDSFNNKKFDDFYELMEVVPTATDSEIKESYEKLSKLNQPGVSEENELFDKLQKLNIAYEVLSDKKMRGNYDKIRDRHVK